MHGETIKVLKIMLSAAGIIVKLICNVTIRDAEAH